MGISNAQELKLMTLKPTRRLRPSFSSAEKFIRLILAGVFALIVAGCGGDRDDNSASQIWLSLLGKIPDSDINRSASILMNDYEHGRRVFKVSIPSDERDEAAEKKYLLELMIDSEPNIYPHGFSPADITGLDPQRLSSQSWKSEVGFSYLQISQDASIDYPERIQILRGHFEPEVIRKAISNDPQWSPRLKQELYAGQTYYSWGSGGQDLRRRTTVRPMGQIRQIQFSVDHVTWVDTPETMQTVLDVAAGKLKSLADRSDYQAIARALAKLDTYTAFFAGDGNWGLKGLNESGCIKPIQVFGSGVGRDAKGFFLAGALWHESPNDASENARALQEHGKVFPKLDGSLVTFKLYEKDTKAMPPLFAPELHGHYFVAQFAAGWPDGAFTLFGVRNLTGVTTTYTWKLVCA